MKHALVTGAAGLLGQHIVKALTKDFYTLAVDINDRPFDQYDDLTYLKHNLTSFDEIKFALDDFAPDFIFNCAGMTNVDDCEKDKKFAHALNVEILENLLRIKFKKLIHLSTDYVFDGHNGPYSEDDKTNPVGYYGETKLKSEMALQESGKDFTIIRTNVLYGTGKDVRPNFITWLVRSLRDRKNLRIVTDQFNNPIHAGNLAEAILEIVEMDYSGIIHIAGTDYLSRYDIAVKTAEHFKLDAGLIQSITTEELSQIARRPLKGGLKIDLAKKLLKTRLLGIDEGLELMSGF